MPDEKGELREINWRQALPWTELFRVFGIALDIRKLLLAAAGIMVMTLGWLALASVFNPSRASPEGAEAERAANRRELMGNEAEYYRQMPWQRDLGPNPFLAVKDYPSTLLHYGFWREQVPVLLDPLYQFSRPIILLFHPDGGFRSSLFAILSILLLLATWALFGGAITRIAAVQIARKENIGLMESLRFSASKFLSFFVAPLFPLLVAGVFTFILALGGILLLIPYLGDVMASLLYPIALAVALVMTIFLLLGLVGWPLMYATISTEGSDSFDAISRSFGYIYQRPWHFLFFSLVSLLYGILVIFFVVFVTSLFVYLAKWAVDLTPNWRDNPVDSLFIYAPSAYDWRALLLGTAPGESSERAGALWDQMNGGQVLGAGIVGLWLVLVFLLMLGFAYSYFWTASTMIYFLLRRKVDDTELDEVYLEDEDEDLFTAPPMPEIARPAGATALPMTEAPAPPPSVATGEPSAGNPPEPAPPGTM